MLRNLIVTCLPMIFWGATLKAQGIEFTEHLSWQEILDKAKTEHKAIFVDCYATWCGPCKAMDSRVYTNEGVGRLMNDKFICVRVQMDTTKNDDAEISSWRSTAHMLQETYHITAYPSFLYFSSTGEVLHKYVGYMDDKKFQATADAALNPGKQFYTLLGPYQRGKRDFRKMANLANAAYDAGEDSLALLIAANYMRDYLTELTDSNLWTKENIAFLELFGKSIKSNDKLFERYYRNRMIIDSVMADKGFSDDLINRILYRDEVKGKVTAAIEKHVEPNWRKIKKAISSRSNEDFALINVTRGRVDFYKATHNWTKYAHYFMQRVELAGIEDWKPSKQVCMALNNDAFEIFKYSRKKKELERALLWVNRALTMDFIKPNAEALDTKANLFYKLGRIEEGKALEAQSVALNPKDKEIAESYQKMKSGLPTWPLQ